MKRLFFILLLLLISCGKNQNNVQSLPHFHETFLRVFSDSTSTWQQVYDESELFADSLLILAQDEENFAYRMIAQRWGLFTMFLLSDYYDELLMDDNLSASNAIKTSILKIYDIVNLWLSSEDEDYYYLWRDHLYSCHKDSEHEVATHISFMISKSKRNPSDNNLRITFPLEANINYPPVLKLRKYYDGSTVEEDPNSEITIELAESIKIESDDEEQVMIAYLSAETIDVLLQYDVMYLLFKSKMISSTVPEETEIALVILEPLKTLWDQI